MEYEEGTSVAPMKTEHWEPPDWEKQLENIRAMRASRDAPVDSVGAHRCYDADAPAHVGVFSCCCCRVVNELRGIPVLSPSGQALPGVGFSHVVQSNQRPGDVGRYAETPSPRLHGGKCPRH